MPEVKEVKNANFKYTIPISKSSADEDGLYLTGEASGPEVDLEGQSVAPEAIVAFAQQIKDRLEKGDPIPYLDSHKDSGVLQQLGDLVDGGVTDESHLWVKVRLDERNPAARFLYQSVQAGKKFGMSVSGSVLSFVDTLNRDTGQMVRVFKSVLLEHISNTTRPVWTPSLGTVLNRAIEKAMSEDMENISNMSEPIVNATPETPEEPTLVATPATPQAAPEVPAVLVAAAPVEPESEENGLSAKVDALATLVSNFIASLNPATPEPVVINNSTETPEPDISKSADERIATLEAELTSLKNESSSQRPPVITKAQRDEFEDVMKELSPSERLRVALALQHGEDI